MVEPKAQATISAWLCNAGGAIAVGEDAALSLPNLIDLIDDGRLSEGAYSVHPKGVIKLLQSSEGEKHKFWLFCS